MAVAFTTLPVPWTAVPDSLLLATAVTLPMGYTPVPEAGRPVPHGAVTKLPTGPVTVRLPAHV